MDPHQHDEADGSSPSNVQNTGTSPHLTLPAPPNPSADRGIVPVSAPPIDDDGALPEGAIIDVFTLMPIAALKMLCTAIETLVHVTGDVPPTPPVSFPSTPFVQIVHVERENRARSDKNERRTPVHTPKHLEPGDGVDEVPAKAKTPIGSPEAGLTEPFHIVGSNMEPLDIQHGAISRKFYSKKPPPIPLEEYLMRLHRYCPMSTAVYLATGLYVHRLAVLERVISVTARNVHRLLLAGLRVAMKALEDLSYPHRRFAKVGGVSEAELGRLEVSFCFLTNFELRVDKEMLLEHAILMRDSADFYKFSAAFQPRFPLMSGRRKIPI